MDTKHIGNFLWNKLHSNTFVIWYKYKDSFDYMEDQMDKSYINFNSDVTMDLLNSVLDKELLQHYKLNVKLHNTDQFKVMIMFLEQIISEGVPISINMIDWGSVENRLFEYCTILDLVKRTNNSYLVMRSSIITNNILI